MFAENTCSEAENNMELGKLQTRQNFNAELRLNSILLKTRVIFFATYIQRDGGF